MPKYVPRKRTVAICQGDDLDRIADLQRKVALADRTSGEPRMGDDADPLRGELQEAIAEAGQRAIAFDISPMAPRAAFVDLLQQHPAREENETDVRVGYNDSTFPPALVAASRPSDDEESVEERAAFLSGLPAGELDRLFEVAWLLNAEPSADPKALDSLTPSPRSTET